LEKFPCCVEPVFVGHGRDRPMTSERAAGNQQRGIPWPVSEKRSDVSLGRQEFPSDFQQRVPIVQGRQRRRIVPWTFA